MKLALALLLSIPLARSGGDPRPEIREYLANCERFGFAGAVLVGQKGKVLVAEGYGSADRERGVKNTPETCFEIASCTKSFTAVAILELAEAGKLELDDPISKHLPGVPESAKGITIRHLLAHTSGMPRSAAGGYGDELEAAVAGYLATPPVRQPGREFEYWNGGYALLAGIVERASGGSYTDWMREHVLEPAKMTSSGFTGDARFAELPVAIGYDEGKEPRRADEHPYQSYGWQYRGMGGLVTNVLDLWSFRAAFFGDALLSKRSREAMLEPGPGKYGLGFYVLDEPRPIVMHGGDVRGFHSQFEFYPKEAGAIVVLSNAGGAPPWVLTENLRSLAFGDPTRYPMPPTPARWKVGELAALAGKWGDGPDEQIEAELDGDALVLYAAGVETALLMWQPGSGAAWSRPPSNASSKLVALAREIAEAVARRDPEPLRRALQPDISADWPDAVVSTNWPAHEAQWGKLKSMRVVGALASSASTTVLLALDSERGSPRLKIVFQGDRLGIFDLHAPRALASLRVVPGEKDRLLGFAWTGDPPPPIEIERDSKKRVRALRIHGSQGSREYIR